MFEQIKLTDYLNVLESPSPKTDGLEIETIVYKVILDKVDSGFIHHKWECGNEYRYSAKHFDNNYFFSVTDSEMGDTVFTSKKEACAKARQSYYIYKVMRADEMKILKERNFVEICTDSRICISATVKILEGNIVYWKEWFTYPFLDVCKTEKEAEKSYKEHLEKITAQLYQPPRFEVNITSELEDVYLCKNGSWSNYEYAKNNGPVLLSLIKD